MKPTLPEDDSHPSNRQHERARAREIYRYDTSYHGLPYPETVPVDDQYTFAALGNVMKSKLDGSINKLLAGVGFMTSQELMDIEARLVDIYQGAVPSMFRAALHIQLRKMGLHLSDKWSTPETPLPNPGDTGDGEQWPFDVAAHRRLAVTLPTPEIASNYSEDWSFAYQRLAGTNPVEIKRFDPRTDRERFPVDDSHLSRALRYFERPTMTLAQAHAEGRLFWVDYAILDGVATGTWDQGRRRKYFYSPMALFIQLPDTGHRGHPHRFMPVAIQCEQPGSGRTPDETPIFVPSDGIKWEMAKLAVQIADTHTHGIVQHLVYCHLYLGSAALAAFRNLAPQHPLFALLEPHFEFTLITADLTRRSTISPGGVTETFQGTSYDGIFQLVKRGLAAFEWDAQSPLVRYATRGVADTESLPDYAFRDDEMLCFEVVRTFVDAYVKLYYDDDAQVGRDHELREFVTELGASDGGQVPGIAPVLTRERLIRFISEIISRATSYHNAINYSVYPYMGFVPNQPLSGYAPPPNGIDEASREDYLRMMPPLSLTIGQMNDYWTVSSMLVNRMGAYPHGHFEDPRVAPLVSAFQQALRDAEGEIDRRNTKRAFPYLLLKPSMTAQSITV
jgi:arachidonate 15-lipoxygenase